MRVGAFLFGGLVGAAAVIYFNNMNRSMMFTSRTAGDTAQNIMNKAKDKLQDMAAMTNMANLGQNTGIKFKDGISQAVEMMDKDPSIKQAVNDILANNGKSPTTITQ